MAQKILVVDDDKDLVFILKETLQKYTYEVLTASNGVEALRILKTNAVDLILADLTMPEMTGWHFTMKVRQDPRFLKTPIIVLSGILQSDADPEEYEAANAYMVKPFDIFKLLDKIKELLSKNV